MVILVIMSTGFTFRGDKATGSARLVGGQMVCRRPGRLWNPAPEELETHVCCQRWKYLGDYIQSQMTVHSVTLLASTTSMSFFTRNTG